MTTQTFAGRLAAFETATLHESGAMVILSSKLRMLSGAGRLAGPALTVMCPPGDNLMIHVAVAQATEGQVLVVQTHDDRYGVWGEVLTVAAQARGAAGLVLDGSVRDLASIARRRFPVFARGVALKGTGKSGLGSVGETISCGGQPVRSGDFIVADESGIVVIPPDQVESIATQAEERVRKEADMMEALRHGRTTLELLGLRQGFSRG
jgi:4-hydroxy-4-methyl-2-oxoglutarate aldolase